MAQRMIPCTHTGSLPRPDKLVKLMFALADEIPVDPSALDDAVAKAIDEIVQKQIDAGVTVINDGEMSKPSYATYVQDRLSGFRGDSVQNYFFDDLQDFPRSAEMVAGHPGRRKRKAPSCTEAITVVNGQAAIDDMTALVAAAKARGHEQIFSSAASPGVISLFFGNDFYDSHLPIYPLVPPVSIAPFSNSYNAIPEPSSNISVVDFVDDALFSAANCDIFAVSVIAVLNIRTWSILPSQ